MVGYINDIKKLVRNNVAAPIQPGNKMLIVTKTEFTKLKTPSNLSGRKNRINQTELNLPNPNARRVPVKKYPAIFSFCPT